MIVADAGAALDVLIVAARGLLTAPVVSSSSVPMLQVFSYLTEESMAVVQR